MAGFFISSDAESIALHSVLMIGAAGEQPVKIKDIASRYGFSEAHLAKVLGRLARAGIIRATRGPSGGYHLSKPAEDITMFEIYCSIKGEPKGSRCLFRISVCEGDCCPLGVFSNRISDEIERKLRQTRLSDIMGRVNQIQHSQDSKAYTSK